MSETFAELLEQKCLLKINDQIEFKEGKFVTCNSDMAYKLTFSVEIELTLMVDEMGRLLALDMRRASDSERDSIGESERVEILGQSLSSNASDECGMPEYPELIDDIETELIEDIELDSVEDDITIEIDDSGIRRTSLLD